MMRGKKTTWRTAAIEFWLGAVSDRELAKLSGVNVDSLRAWRRGLGIASQGRSVGENFNRASARYGKIAALLLSGVSIPAIAHRFQTSESWIYEIAKREGLVRVWTRRGESASKQRG